MPSDLELVSTLQDRIDAKLDTQLSLAKELGISQGHFSKLLKSRRMTAKMRARIVDLLRRPQIVEEARHELVAARRILRKCEQIMHNMHYLLTDVQRMCDQIASIEPKAKT